VFGQTGTDSIVVEETAAEASAVASVDTAPEEQFAVLLVVAYAAVKAWPVTVPTAG